MGWLLGALAVGSALVVGAGIAFVCDELSQHERRRQDKMRDEYYDYERRRQQEYYDTCSYYENARRNSDIEYSRAIFEYQQELIRRRKIENRATLEKMILLFDDQYLEKTKLLKECQKIVDICENSIGKQQNSYVRFKSIKSTLISLQEAVYKLEAYIRYMDDYKKSLEEKFEAFGEILEPFSMILPKDYPYEGKVIFLEKDSFRNYGYVFENVGYIRLDKSDYDLFDSSDSGVGLPFMAYAARNGRLFLSLSKGLLKNSIGGTIGIGTEVVKVYPKLIKLRFMGHNYIPISIFKQDLISQRRRTPIGSNLQVFVKNYDFALKKPIIVSEKIGDGLSIAQFTNIALLQTGTEYQELYEYLKKNDLLDEDDEWRIAPIMDQEKGLIGVIMQIGYSYAYKAFFEEILEGKLVLRYGGMVPKEELISFDDIFVATNVTVDCYTPTQIQEDSEQYEDYFEECQKLQLYLISEFATQSKIMINSPMSVYLNQWAEITNRLIELLGYGSHIKVSVLEWEYFSIRGIGVYTILFIDKPEKILNFIGKEKDNNRYKFFIAIAGQEMEKISCKVIEGEDGELSLRLNGRIDVSTLLNNDFMLDMYSVAIPYAEKQHANAFSMFKEGRVVSEEVKAAIVNTSRTEYRDNGYRIPSFFNKKIQSNETQLDAVIRAFGEERFFLIQGPPGTGKTTVIKELILQQLQREPSARVLVVSQANVAVDNVLRGIVEISTVSNYIESAQIVRCGTIDKIAEDIEEYSFDKKYEQYKRNLQEQMPTNSDVLELRKKWLQIIGDKNSAGMVGECLLSCFQIIGATCVGLESRHYGLNSMEFDLVIIDESGKALAGELLIPINRAKKVIVIGDHKQLPPVINTALYKGGKVNYDDVVEEEQQLDFLNRSFFERLYETCPDELKCMLNIQFRMPPVIADLVNMFYDGTLKTGDNCFRKKPIFCGNHLIFVDMKDIKDYREQQNVRSDGGKSSPYNEKEVEATIALVGKIRKYYSGRIVVITPYKRQKIVLIKGLKQCKFDNVWVNTIDAFQGDEEDIVIYCTTRAVQPTKYFSDSARLNVAFSRARNTLIFLGSSRYLKKYPKDHILHRVSDYLETKATVIQYENWLKDDFDMQYNSTYNIENDNLEFKEESSSEVLSIQANFFNMINSRKSKIIETCKGCSKQLKDGEYILCENCIIKSEMHKCKCCGRDISFSYYDKYVQGDKLSEICCDCEAVNCYECRRQIFIQKNHHKELMKSSKKVLCCNCQEKYRSIAYTKSCKKCGNKITLTYAAKMRIEEQEKALPIICNECKKKGNESVQIGICQVCDKPIVVKRLQYEKYGDTINTEMHKDCSQETYSLVICEECYKPFNITYGEKLFFDKKGFSLPKRCKTCRKNR